MPNIIDATLAFAGRKASEEVPTSTPDRRLKWQSRWLSRLFLAALVVAGAEIFIAFLAMLLRIGTVAGMQGGGFAFMLPSAFFSGDAGAAFVPISQLPVWKSTLAAFLVTLRLLPGLFILWHLHVLFRLYSCGQVFARRNAQQMRRIAFALLIYAVVPFVTHGALFFADMATTAFKMEIRQVDALVLGLVLFTIAQVMKFGHEIESDREGFV
ncbi:DUF2975 domain-containing protein [Dyella sp.]|uniref:DUF2975 domain-containing protein n=1 Tax=Dyella sp. TaxID=1869338 RepID=UPI002ED369A9